jgi:hypothetical protein
MKKLLIACLMPIFIHAQKEKEHQIFDKFGLQGRVFYSGEWNENQLPQKGAYKLIWRNLSCDTIQTFFANGKTLNHLPTGVWQWQEGIWHSNYAPGSTIYPELKSSGLIYSWNGSFTKGLPHGAWQFTADSSSANEITHNIASGKANFNEGILSGKFSLETTRNGQVLELIGETDKKGLIHGSFTISVTTGDTLISKINHTYQNGLYLNTVEEVFVKGKMMSQTKSFGHQSKLFLDKNSPNPYPIELSDSLFTTDNFETIDSVMPLVLVALTEFIQGGWQLESFPYTFDKRGPYFKKLIYPFTIEEKEQINNINQKVETLLEKVDQRLVYRNLLLSRSASADVDIAIGHVELTAKKLNQINVLLAEAEQPSYVFKFRHDANFAKNWLLPLVTDDLITGEFFDTLSPYPVPNNFELPVFELLTQYIFEIESSVDKHLFRVDSAYETRKREVEIELLEDELSKKIALLETTYQNATGFALYVRNRWIQEFLYQQVSEYSSVNEFFEQKQRITSILLKADTLLALYATWQILDAASQTLQENYTQFEYNPFNGKFDIEKRKKRRFYNRISGTWLPWMDAEMQRIDDWNEWLAFVSTYKSKVQCLIDFANHEDNAAQRLEKRVRDERSPEKILKSLQNYCRRSE